MIDEHPRHRFIMVLQGLRKSNFERDSSKLYDAGVDDGGYDIYGNEFYISFARSAETYRKAVMSARADVKRAKIGATVKEIRRLQVQEVAGKLNPKDTKRKRPVKQAGLFGGMKT